VNGTYEFFTRDELCCKHCEQCHMNGHFMGEIDAMRAELDFPMTPSSAYRCLNHPDEINKDEPGAHTFGRAIDLLLNRSQAYQVMQYATTKGWRVGLKQKPGTTNAQRFIHLDNMTVDDGERFGSPLWTY